MQGAPGYRDVCSKCRKAAVTCYCTALRPFTAPFPIGILQHPYEARNAIATARMTHLSILNSQIFVGPDFTNDSRVNALLNDPRYRHVMLFPSPEAIELDDCFAEAAANDSRQLYVWVLDAKWHQVKQMLRLSSNIREIPMVKFTPEKESQFIIRKQPKTLCLSTIESVHLVLDRYFARIQSDNQEHHGLLTVFQHLVQQQIDYAKVVGDFRHARRRPRFRPQTVTTGSI